MMKAEGIPLNRRDATKESIWRYVYQLPVEQDNITFTEVYTAEQTHRATRYDAFLDNFRTI